MVALQLRATGCAAVRPADSVADTLCRNVTCDKYFVHGLSHWLGMDVRDVGDIRAAIPSAALPSNPRQDCS